MTSKYAMGLLALTLALGSAASYADSADPPYAAQQCTRYNRPAPKSKPLTDQQIRACCDDQLEGVQKAVAQCVKLVKEIEGGQRSGEKARP